MMARFTKSLLVFGLLACFHTPAAFAHSKHKGDLHIQHPWTREGTAPVAIVLMTIKNAGDKPDKLLSAESKLGAARLTTVVELQPKALTALTKNGPHIEITGLKAPLTAYDRLPMTLTFENSGAVEIEVMVEPVNEP